LHGNTLSVGGAIDAHGNFGGTVDLTGNVVDLLSGAIIDATGLAGGGAVHVGGDLHGAGPLPDASTTQVEQGAVIDVSSLSGAGGSAVVWADGSTWFGGTILGRGGTTGGSAEVSGKGALGFDGTVDLSGAQGAAGTLLLDPTTAEITNTNSATNDGSLPTVNVPASGTYQISVAAIETASASADISITATDSITIDDLSLSPGSNVLAIAGGHSLTFDTTGTFSFANAANEITTAGGTVSITAGTIGTLGTFNVGSGTLSLDATASGVALNTLTAGALNVTAAGNITEVSGSTITVTGAATFATTTAYDVDLTGATSNSFGSVTVTEAKDVLLGNLSNFAGTFTLTVTDPATIVKAMGGTVTLTDGTLTVGAKSLSLSGVKTAELDGSGGSSTLDASGFSGTVTLVADGGSDTLKGAAGNNAVTTYIFPATFGTDTVVSQLDAAIANNNNDTLNLDAVSTSDAITVGAGSQLQIAGGTHGTINQTIDATHAAAAHLDVTLSSSLQAAFGAFLAEFVAFGGAIDAGTALPELSNPLPGFNPPKGRNASIAGLLGLANVFTKLKGALSPDASGDLTQTTFSQVVAALNANSFAFTAPAINDPLAVGLTAKATGTYRGDASGGLELLLDLPLMAEIKPTLPMGLGVQAQTAGITVSGTINVDAKMTSDLKVGVDTTGTPHAFLDGNSTASLSIHAAATNFSASVILGFLDASTSPNNSITLDGTLPISFAAGENSLGTTPTSLTTLSATVGTPTGAGFSVDLPVTVSAGSPAVLDSATQSLLNGAELKGTVGIGSLFENGQPSYTSGGNLLQFGNLTPSSVLGLLGNVLTSFAGIDGNSLLQTQIPFTGQSLSTALDFVTNFKHDVLDPLTNSTTGQPTFSSLQTLMTQLNSALGLPAGTLQADISLPGGGAAGQVTFEIKTPKLIDVKLGGTPGTLTVAIDDPTVGATFALGFKDANGVYHFTPNLDDHTETDLDLQAKVAALDSSLSGKVTMVTGTGTQADPFVITFDNSISVPLLRGVESKELLGSFPINLNVNLGDLANVSTNVSGKGDITNLSGTILNMDSTVTAKLSVGEVVTGTGIPSGATIGTIGTTSITLNGTTTANQTIPGDQLTFIPAVQIWGGVDADLTFGINLNPTTSLVAAPSAFAPTTAVNINVVQAGGGGTNGEQTITVHNANAGTYKLIFTLDPTDKTKTFVTDNINWSDGASTIQSKLLNALDEATGTIKLQTQYSSTSIKVTAAASSPTGDPVFTVDFADKLAGLQIPSLSVLSPSAIAGTANNGILRNDLTTNDATFAVRLVQSPTLGRLAIQSVHRMCGPSFQRLS
jgi:hypothetical protein